MDFNTYQSEAKDTDETGKATIALYGLAGEIGGLFSLYKKKLRDRQSPSTFRDDLAEELGDILWYLTILATKNDISLNEIATKSLEKTKSLFGHQEAPFFDTDYPEGERLPDNLIVQFMLDQSGNRANMLIEGKPVGDALSDNVLNEDDYRFHDVFHLSFLAHLHWSPVLRRLLKRKRKSRAEIDEAEDGARAAIVEEAAIGIIFSYAEQNAFFPDLKSVPLSLIKILQRLTSKYEVSRCTAAHWREAIFEACSAFSQLSQNKGGYVLVDAIESRLEYSTSYPG